MSTEMLQHAIVTLVALAAGTAVVRRIFGFVGRRARRTGCASCASGSGACATPAQSAPDVTVQRVAVLTRPPAVVRSGPPS